MALEWEMPERIPALGADCVQVWRLSPDGVGVQGLLAGAARILSADEVARAEKIRVDRVRTEFVAARMLLRTLLAAATGETAEELVFGYEAAGKPWLKGHPEVEFNVSHAGGRIVIALTRRGAVGVDVESPGESRIGVEEMVEIAEASLCQRCPPLP